MTEGSLTASEAWVASGFGPMSAPLEVHWNEVGAVLTILGTILPRSRQA